MHGIHDDLQCSTSVARGGGRVVWITGLSGAGKTTVADRVVEALRNQGRPVVLLDGDEMRAVFGSGLGHSRDDRLHLAQAYGRLCALLAGQGLTVVCATISLFAECHRWNRDNLPGYLEVYLRVPQDVLAARDPKGLYAAVANGSVQHVHGHDLPFDEPASPDLVIDNHGPTSPEQAARLVVGWLNGSPS